MARSGHGVIQVDNEFVVVGGHTHHMPSESCKLVGQIMTCAERKPKLSVFGPELMLILA